MSDNSFNNTVESLFKGMDNFITTKTVIGDAVRFEDGTIVLPLVDVSFGVAAGAFSDDSAKKNNGGGGMGGKIQPSAVLVIKDGTSRLVNVKLLFLFIGDYCMVLQNCWIWFRNLWKNSPKRTRKTKKTENKMRITKKNQKI